MVGIFEDPAALHSTVIAQAAPILVVAPTASVQPTALAETAPQPVLQATPDSRPRPRSQVSAPICLNETVSDTAIYEDPADPAKSYFLPRYRAAYEAVNDQPRFQVSLHQASSSQDWELTVTLEAYPAPEIAERSRSAEIMPHDVQIILRYISRGESIPTDLTFQRVRSTQNGYEATLTISDLSTKHAVFLELTTSDRVTSLVVRRSMTVAVPLRAAEVADIQQDGPRETLYTAASYRMDMTARPSPFVFPTSAFGYVTAGVQPPTDSGSRLRLCQARWLDRELYFPYYQNVEQGRRFEFFYLPDTFKLSRDQMAPHGPTMSVKYELSDDGSEVGSVTLQYRLAPYTDPRRLAAAATDLKSYVDSSSPDGIQLKPLMAVSSLQLTVRFPGQSGPVPRPDATVNLQYGIEDVAHLSGEHFQELYAAMFNPSGKNQLFSGVVSVVPAGFSSNERQQIPFVARMNDTVGPICDFTATPHPSGNLLGRLQNQIESPVRITQIAATVWRQNQSGSAETREFTPPLPATLNPCDEETFVIVPPATLPQKGSLRAKVDLPGLTVQLDREGVYDSILDGESPESYTRTVRVWTQPAVFEARPHLAALKVDFKRGGSVQLTSDRLEGRVTVRMPVKSFVLQLPEEGTYSYCVTTIGMDGSTSPPDCRTDSTDNLPITVA